MRSLIDLSKKYPLSDDDLTRMGIGRTFHGAKLDAIPDQAPYKKALKTWIERMPAMLHDGIGMILHGEFRKGKTSGAVICMKAVAVHGGTAHLIRADGVASSVVNDEMYDDFTTVEGRCRAVDLLALDEMVYQGGREQTNAMIERLIRWRYDRQLSMIVTTNDLKGIEARYGSGLAKVLKARCLPVEVGGTNWLDTEVQHVKDMFEGKGGGA